MKTLLKCVNLLIAASLLVLASCGGGGGGGNGVGTAPTPQPVSPPTLTITNGSLPEGVQGAPYSATLTAQNGTAPYKWSVDPNTQNPLPAGVSLDASTGVLSGTPAVAGYFNVSFAVTDSSTPAKSVWSGIPLQVASPLAIQMYQTTLSMTEYQSLNIPLLNVSGGIPPYAYSVTQGSLPPGLGLDPFFGSFTGAPAATGTYTATLAVKDSYSPADHQNAQPITIIVSSYPLQITSALTGVKLILNKPFSGNFVAVGGTTPYTFAIASGSLPPGLSLSDATTGLVSGTPTSAGAYSFLLQVTDSQSQTQVSFPTLTVSAAVGRNDTAAKATPVGNGTSFASISPILDSTGSLAPDTDYYKLVAQSGSTVHVETFAKRNNANNPLDTVIELTDVNGGRLSTGCNAPGGTATFTTVCLNDDISASPHVQDSALDYKVPGTTGTQVFLLHVLDWSGNARPDMSYTLQITGVVDPLKIGTTSVPGQLLNTPYVPVTLTSSGGFGTITWAVSSGSLPPGMVLSPAGVLSGTPTTIGTYPFTVTATDSSTPPQLAVQALSMSVGVPPQITSTSFPDAYTGVAYDQPVSYTGGTHPFNWTFSPITYSGPCCIGIDQATGHLNQTPANPGPYSFGIGIVDAIGLIAPWKQYTINILPGPLYFSTTSLPNAHVGQSYNTAIVLRGGTPPFSYTVTSGALPPGLTFGFTPGLLLGTPTAAGTYTFTITASDSGSPTESASQTETLTVTP